MTEEKTNKKCGFISIIGAPNAGKSTLMNAILGSKISIVSHKSQTTRTRITGIYTERDTQIIFMDTPGLFTPTKRFEKAIYDSIWKTVHETNTVLFIFDAVKKNIDEKTRDILAGLKKMDKTIYLCLNKVDLIAKEKLLSLATEFDSYNIFKEIFMVSALKENGLDSMMKSLENSMPSCEWIYPEDQITNISTKLLAAEITREKIFHYLHDEIPYTSTVETDEIEHFKDGSVKFHQTIYIERNGQKKIVLGKDGAMIKKIGSLARADLEELLEKKVHLTILVKDKENWMNDIERYIALGLNFNS